MDDVFGFVLHFLALCYNFSVDNDGLCALFCIYIPVAMEENAVCIFHLCDNILFGAAIILCDDVDLVPG